MPRCHRDIKRSHRLFARHPSARFAAFALHVTPSIWRKWAAGVLVRLTN